jgi:ribose 1,5-bisphosphokinase
MITQNAPGGTEAGDGCLVLVVGPSGAGKDSLIDIARVMLEQDSRFVFPTRMITRHADSGGEQHVQISESAFEQMRKSGAFFLSWQAHGHGYGLPADIKNHLKLGRVVIVNVSRSVIEEAKSKTPRVSVVHVTAPKDVVAARLKRRNREQATEIEERLARYEGDAPVPEAAITIDTRDPGLDALETAASRFVQFLSTATSSSSPGPVIRR